MKRSEEPERVPPGDLTLFLRDLSQGDERAATELMPYVYSELKAIAQACLGTPEAGRTLQPTALVNEAFLKLFGGHPRDLEDRKHFFRLAAKVMRQLVVDHARARGRRQRSDHEVTLDEAFAAGMQIDCDLLDLDSALTELTSLDGRQARVVELRYFAGLEMADVAEALEISKSTAEREWRSARAWLGVRLRGGKRE